MSKMADFSSGGKSAPYSATARKTCESFCISVKVGFGFSVACLRDIRRYTSATNALGSMVSLTYLPILGTSTMLFKQFVQSFSHCHGTVHRLESTTESPPFSRIRALV